MVLVRWPDEQQRLEQLRDQGKPRLLLVHTDSPPPAVDDGLEDWIRVPAGEMDRVGAVVSRDALAKAGWPAGAPGRNALDVHVLRLRRRLEPVGLAIRTVRSRGYLLERRTRGHGQLAASD